MPDEARPPQDDDSVLSRLWEIAHKYQRSLARGEVLPVAESEGDRRVVAPFGRRLSSTSERNLDGMTYRSLAEMQVRRDSRRLLSNLPARARLLRLGFEVAVRAKPVVFLHAPAAVRPPGLLASVAYETLDMAALDETGDVLSELEDSEHRVRMSSVDEAQLEALRGEVKRRLIGQRLHARDLARSLTSNEADLLSQLARRGEVVLVADRDGSVEIREGEPARKAGPTIAMVLRPARRRERHPHPDPLPEGEGGD